MASKIIVVGDVNGQLSDLFGKLSKLHAKNSFAFAIVAGKLFADPASATDEQNQDVIKLLRGDIEVPLPTYFSRGNFSGAVVEKLTSNDGELCPNLSILGRRFKTSEGFKIVAIDGVYTPKVEGSIDDYAAIYTDKDFESAKEFKDADILVTSDWPAEVRDGSKVSYAGEAPAGFELISDLCATLKPRYHFSSSTSIFEREPFFHPEDPPQPTTRFISLAPLNNPNKAKALYAFSLEPSSTPTGKLEGCTASPFATMAGRKRGYVDRDDPDHNSFRFSNGGKRQYHGGDDDGGYRPKRQRGGRGQPLWQKKDECFFCTGSPKFEAHMLASMHEEAYVTVAKGPLSIRKTFPDLGHPCHMLIIPIAHAPTFATWEPELRKTVFDEMDRYRKAIESMIATKSTKGSEDEAQLGAVTWEISKGSGVHLHWQIMPISSDMIKRGLVEAAFDVEAENLHYSKFAKDDKAIKEAEEGDYFKAIISSESGEKKIVLPLEKGMRFDLQFGRRILGKLLGLENRTHWRDVHQSEEEEAADAQRFKDMFEAYDFALLEFQEQQAKEEQEREEKAQTEAAEPKGVGQAADQEMTGGEQTAAEEQSG